jgi:hypothetical protein
MALKLTARQSQILDIIRLAIQQTGRPPTRAEIARQLGFRSANAAEDHLRALERKGYIHLSAATSRGIQLTGQALAAAADADPTAPEGATAPAGGRPTAPPGAPTWIASSDSRLVPLVGRVAADLQPDEGQAGHVRAQLLAIGPLQGRATEDDAAGGEAGQLQAQRFQPGRAVLIRQRDAGPHLRVVFLTMEGVAFDKGPILALRQQFADRGLAAAGYAHHDHRAGRTGRRGGLRQGRR